MRESLHERDQLQRNTRLKLVQEVELDVTALSRRESGIVRGITAGVCLLPVHL